MNLQRFLGIALITSLMILAGINAAEAARKKTVTRQPDRFAEVVIEASTGYVLSERNADKKLYPASLTKMMTLYMTFEAMDKGALDRYDRITVSKRAAAQEPSSLGLRTGDLIRIEDAILAIATKSANDCAVALAEAVGGSEPKFARAMTLKARQLGMTNTNFVNASGLFNRAQISTARDMAILSQALLRDYPKYYRYFSTTSFTYEGNTYYNHNKLMNTYPGMDGLKTGYVYASGYNLAASAVRDGTRLIGIVFGGRTAVSRNNAMAQLLDQSFARVGNIRLASLVKTPAPVRRPISSQANEEISVDNISPAAGAPQFDAMGLVMDQGDTDISSDDGAKKVRIIHGLKPAEKKTVTAQKTTTVFQPSSLNTKELLNPKAKGDWAIQIGAFASRDAGIKALETAKSNLSKKMGGVDAIAPLMTNRGMIYRARLSGLARNDAAQACRILKGSCLILAVE